PAIYLREWKMNEQNSSLLRKRNVLIGGGVAIAAALLALSYTMDFPSGVQNTVGTIVPAQRYKAAQPVIEDIKASGQAATQSVPLQAGSATNAAANSAVTAGTSNNSVNAGTVNSTINAATGNNGITAGTANNMINAATTNNAVSAGTVNANVNATTNNAVSAAS